MRGVKELGLRGWKGEGVRCRAARPVEGREDGGVREVLTT